MPLAFLGIGFPTKQEDVEKGLTAMFPGKRLGSQKKQSFMSEECISASPSFMPRFPQHPGAGRWRLELRTQLRASTVGLRAIGGPHRDHPGALAGGANAWPGEN